MPLLRRRSVLQFASNPIPDHSRDNGSDAKAARKTLKPPATGLAARPRSAYGERSRSRLSHELHPDDIGINTDGEGHAKARSRFSLMKLRNLSEPHLSAHAESDAERAGRGEDNDQPPVPAIGAAESILPTIVKTAPTMDRPMPTQGVEEAQPRPSLLKRASSRRRLSMHRGPTQSTEGPRSERKGSSLKWRRGKSSGLEDLHRLSTMHLSDMTHQNAPPAYGEESNSTLAVPVLPLPHPRDSESSRSDGSNGSSGDGHVWASTTTTTHTVSTHTTFFRLPGRNKNRHSLFPLPAKSSSLPEPVSQHDPQGPVTPRASTRSPAPDAQVTPTDTSLGAESRRAHTEASPNKKRAQTMSAASSRRASPTKPSAPSTEPPTNLFRRSSTRSQASIKSSPLRPPMRLGLRDRSSTTSSFGARSSYDVEMLPPPSRSGRNSTSTAGRSSFGGLLNLSRFRQSSEPHSPGTRSKSNSFAMSREALVIPEREEGDTPGKYLERLESAVARSVIAGILSKSSDPFAQAVLRSYTRRFPFFGEPIDMSLRKFLLEAELPKETQQVDRVIQAFADRYHECNPGLFTSTDTAYVVAFSIMMLHTDAFNKNNKRKMQKQDYIKNTSGQGVSDDILGCFYDNICYTPFIHYDEDVHVDGERVLPFKSKRPHGKLKSAIPGADAVIKKPSGPVDPYNLIVEQRLDTLRPPIKDSIMVDDPYDYRTGQGELDPQYLQRAFTHTGVIQIISARSRPAAYESQFVNGQPNPTETQQGIVDLKITKVGLLWRKSAKKKKTRSPWQEWGAILTGSQLYLFKNSHWAKGLMHQFQNHQKPGQRRTPVVFKPPLQDFKPDALIKTDNAVALVDFTYTRHKHAFTFVRPGGQEETLLADNESELNDWLGLINYAAAFRAAGVRIRGMVGGNEEDQRASEVRRLDSTNSMRSIQIQMGEVTVQNRSLTPQLQRQVMAARRQIMVQKISEIEKEVVDANRQLDMMLRNARHLLVLAPIAARTREDVIHAAARADAMIKWCRRDMWRMKCHRDILAMDVRIDGMSASELEKLTQNQTYLEAESARKDKPKILTRLSSAKTAKSPPQSPMTTHATARPSARASLDTFSTDAFRTPPESASSMLDDPWRLPPMNLDPDAQEQHRQHRPSVTSTLLSISPPASHASLQHSHSASSILQVTRTGSLDPPEYVGGPGGRITPAASVVDERDLQLMARSTSAALGETSAPRDASLDGPMLGVSPEGRPKGVRRSLHKTLRDHHGSTTHRHRRNKDSDSTVRSGGQEDRESEEITPGLTREKPRFILHGKQASVVQFGGDWERMRLRRENYGGQGPATNQSQSDAAYQRRVSEQHELLRAGMVSPVIHDIARGCTTDEDEETASMLSDDSRGFRQDAEAAAAYAKAAQSSRDGSSSEGVSNGSGFFDLSGLEPDTGRRTTVIGPFPADAAQLHPLHHRRFSSLQKGQDGTIEAVEDVVTKPEDPTVSTPLNMVHKNMGDRCTVLDPSTSLPSATAGEEVMENRSAQAQWSSVSAGASAADDGWEASSILTISTGEVDEHGFVRAVNDDELRDMMSIGTESSPQTVRKR